MRKIMVGLLLLLLAGCGSASTGAVPTTTFTVAPLSAQPVLAPTTTLPSTTVTTSDGLTDNGWIVTPETFTTSENALGNFVGVVRVENGNLTPSGASFTFTLYNRAETEVAELEGAALPTLPGATVTVLLLSSIPWVSGTYTYTFTAS